MPALNAELSGRNNIKDNYRIRRLTPFRMCQASNHTRRL